MTYQDQVQVSPAGCQVRPQGPLCPPPGTPLPVMHTPLQASLVPVLEDPLTPQVVTQARAGLLVLRLVTPRHHSGLRGGAAGAAEPCPQPP